MSTGEASDTFACFGSTCSVHVTGHGPARSAREAVELARTSLLKWHERFSRFEPDSELSQLNRDPRETVPVSPLMLRLALAVREAGASSDGLVDATLLEQIERAGYREDLAVPLALPVALRSAPARRPARAAARQAWRELEVDGARCTLSRAPGVALDSGGLAKGMFADVLGELLAEHDAYAVNCAGDLRIGGERRVAREVRVESPFDGSVLHTLRVKDAGVATSGIGRRAWRERGAPAHHLLDPSTGAPAYTGVVQVTALAPSALQAEIRAKAAILSGPREAPRWLRDGGVIVLEDGSYRAIEPPPTVSLEELSAFATRAPAAVGEQP